MNIDLIFAIIFYGLILIFFLRNREKFTVQGKIIALYRTKLGLKAMDRMSKFLPGFWKVLGIIGVVTGFIGMAFILYMLITGTWALIFSNAPPALSPVLPGVRIPGLPNLSFWHWVVGIFFVAVVHEFAHGIYARLYNVKVKNSGFVLFGPILGAFVEPDEKKLMKEKKKVQLSVFAAGPFSNIVFAIIFFLLMSFVTAPIQNDMLEGNGIQINKVLEGYPAEKAGLPTGVILTSINGKSTLNADEFMNATEGIKPNEKVILETDKGTFEVTTISNPDDETKGFMGVTDFNVKTKIKEEVTNKYGTFLPGLFSWVALLVFWLFVINFGIGLFNLLPLGPIDGGRMLYAGLLGIFNKEKATKIWLSVTYFCLLLIFINLLPWLYKLLLFILRAFTPFS